eukprot:Nitzschia sp. Nitz4//scaffold138_size62050//50933//51220//NITZ4_006397-RA/size62050-processed-gene-0.24-mRNA-1//-1//CDS//3329535794//8841//frame0
MALLRYQYFLSLGISFLSAWWYACQQLTSSSSTATRRLVLSAPVWAVFALGIYAVSSIAVGLARFKDVPEAASEIEQQVKEAKEAMIQRGVIEKQ